MSRLLYAAAVTITLGAASLTFAQGTGTGGGFGGTGTGGGFGGSGTSGFGGGGTTFGGGGSTFGGGGTSFSGSTGGFSGNLGGNTSTGGGRTGAGGRTIGGTSAVSISPTNFLAATYGNPLYNGRPGSSNTSLTAGGGFGQPSFGAVTTTTQNGVTTTRGGQAGTTGLGGRATVNSGLGMINAGGPPITYTLDVKFPVPAVASPQVQANLQGIVSRTSQLKQPGLVTVLVDGDTAILRGRVADEDEKRLVEGMIRLEPGIKDVRNELTFP